MTRLRGLTSVVVALLSGSLSCGGGQPVLPSSASKTGDAAAAAVPTPAPNLGPPNVVLILADDLGWGDLGSYGNRTLHTPNLDRLAAEGVRFTSFYTSAPICAPSRAGLLTGRYPTSVGIPWNPPVRLNRGEVVIATPLRNRGYATGMVGKWHLGWERTDMPVYFGFDFYYGVPAGEDETDFIYGDQPTRDTVSSDQLARRYTEEAVRFIADRGSRPVFMYVAHRDPHLDNTPAPEFVGHSGVGAYGDVVEQLDATVGTLMAALRTMGIDQNTLVIFTSDNGPVTPPGSAGPYSGGKGSCEEGGIRVPLIMRWPARIPAGRVVTEPASNLDLFPTLLTFTGASAPYRSLHGQDIARLVTGEVDRIGGQGEGGGRELVFFGQSGAAGLRSGKWKYLRQGLWSGTATLFDLEADPAEKRDLSRARPDLTKQLEARLQDLSR
ncbi:MAG TPA: sulfatase-like hydrolase/transferase [Vicinamibacteria bacterium]